MEKVVLASTLLLVFLSVAGSFAAAEETNSVDFTAHRSVVVIDEVVPSSTNFVDASFNFDKNSGDAWVEAETTWNDDDPDVEKAKVSNLSFIRSSMQIIYDESGRKIVCANVKGPSWTAPLGDTVKPTGNCRLRGSIQDRNQDNGFGRDTVSYLHVEMDLK
jgi:hypothetical protein